MNSAKKLLLVGSLVLGTVILLWIASPTLPEKILSKTEIFVNQQLASWMPISQADSAAILAANPARKRIPSGSVVTFAAIGDYGTAGKAEADIASLVTGWKPDFILAVGDNNYDSGAAGTIDDNIGQYYHNYIFPYVGKYGPGATTNQFFPVLGNHDWISTNAQPYDNYFLQEGSKRYYDFVRGPVHFFMLDSDAHEPDGISATSTQALWLKTGLANSTSQWNVIVLHHAPYSSGKHGSTLTAQWPFAAWGADAVISGHDHTYERLLHDQIPYFVDGLGGSSIYEFGEPLPGSQVRYNADYGALRVTASDSALKFEFINRGGVLIDTFSLGG